ncbi:MAG: hypothetical protein LBC56_08185 [Oscillospiraceae bacterium]|jgi:DNA-directed RNA polymerase subunit RPC12/RpoP|nr:hypothetical protein [Oscillospiraceae bacterium]
MYVTEKAAYLKGLIDGVELDDSKESRIIKAMAEVIGELAEAVSVLQEDGEDLYNIAEELQECIDDIQDIVYDEGEHYCSCRHSHSHGDTADEDDEEERELVYETICPTCGAEVLIDSPEDGEVNCPECGELLEFDIEDLEGKELGGE